MKQPIKIIFDDDSEELWDDSEVLEYVDDDEIRSYAEWDLDMQSEYGVDDPDISDFNTDELLDELFHRYKIHKDIISIKRFDEFLNNFYNL
jgi:hypothetical protein